MAETATKEIIHESVECLQNLFDIAFGTVGYQNEDEDCTSNIIGGNSFEVFLRLVESPLQDQLVVLRGLVENDYCSINWEDIWTSESPDCKTSSKNDSNGHQSQHILTDDLVVFDGLTTDSQ